jgi:hypothetical protein
LTPALLEDWIFVLVQKDSNAKKKKLLLHGTLKLGPSLPLTTMKSKKENQVFLSRQFCASLAGGLLGNRH